uniref:Uncharacterized protein n=1 Tax=Timema bartmani TaxID=61472 RepID=A0A7R9I6X0_9NEOP|nr:unnamed protein product [Timema bartmani]
MKSVSCKTAMVLVAVMVMVMTVPTRARDEQYTSKYDDMDVDHIMKSDRLTDSYVNCLLDQGPCTPEGKNVRRVRQTTSARVEDKTDVNWARVMILYIFQEVGPLACVLIQGGAETIRRYMLRNVMDNVLKFV